MRISKLILTICILWGCSLGLAQAQTDAMTFGPPRPTYEVAMSNLKMGVLQYAEHYLETLSKNEAAQYDNRLLSALLMIHRLHLDQAQSELNSLAKAKKLDQSMIHAISAAQAQVKESRRMMNNVFIVPIIKSGVYSSENALEEVKTMTSHLGKSDKTSYTTPDGSTQWVVLTAESGQPKLGIMDRLGDGTLDKDNVKEVEIPGLSAGGEVIYPFLMSDGETLYFSYAGPESMGAHDIFVTRYDRSAGTLLVPQQLPIPYNSPGEEYAYILDDETKVGYLLTGREAGRNDSMRLIVFKTDEQKKVDDTDPDVVRSIALLDSVVKADMPMMTLRPAEQTSARPLLKIGQRAVYKEEDLSTADARATFRRMTELMDKRDRISDLLSNARKSLSEGKKGSMPQKNILELEEGLLNMEQEIVALRNAIIRQEENSK